MSRSTITKSVFTPLSIDLVREIINMSDPVNGLTRQCQPLQAEWSLKQIDRTRIRACIDERQDVVVISHKYKSPSNTIKLNGETLFVETNDVIGFENRDHLPMSSFPSGAVGVIVAGLFAQLARDAIDRSNIRSPMEYVSQCIKSTFALLPQESKSLEPIPVHIDNTQGNIPILVATPKGSRIHLKNIQFLLEKGLGCGAAAQVFQTIYCLFIVFGMPGRAHNLLTALHGYKTEQELCMISQDLSNYISKLLIHHAVSQGSNVDVYTGHHDAQNIIFSFGNQSIDRVILRANTHMEMFKSDLGEGRAYDIIKSIFNTFGITIDPLRYLIAVHLITYILLGQQNKPRLYIPK